MAENVRLHVEVEDVGIIVTLPGTSSACFTARQAMLLAWCICGSRRQKSRYLAGRLSRPGMARTQ